MIKAICRILKNWNYYREFGLQLVDANQKWSKIREKGYFQEFPVEPIIDLDVAASLETLEPLWCHGNEKKLETTHDLF